MENEQPETMAVISVEGAEPVLLTPEAPEAEAIEEVAEAIEEVSSDAVEIARIEADAEIAVEAIHADAQVQQAEIAAEVRTAEVAAEQEQTTWQENRIAELEANMTELKSRVEPLLSGQALTPPALTEVAAEVAAEAAAEPLEVEQGTISTLLSMSPETSETQTEVTLESEEGEQVAQVTVKKRRRLI